MPQGGCGEATGCAAPSEGGSGGGDGVGRTSGGTTGGRAGTGPRGDGPAELEPPAVVPGRGDRAEAAGAAGWGTDVSFLKMPRTRSMRDGAPSDLPREVRGTEAGGGGGEKGVLRRGDVRAMRCGPYRGGRDGRVVLSLTGQTNWCHFCTTPKHGPVSPNGRHHVEVVERKTTTTCRLAAHTLCTKGTAIWEHVGVCHNPG